MTSTPHAPYKQLRRPTTDRMVAGVASGVGRYLGVDPTLVRVVFAVGTVLTGGIAALAYPIMWFLMPAEPASAPAWPHPTGVPPQGPAGGPPPAGPAGPAPHPAWPYPAPGAPTPHHGPVPPATQYGPVPPATPVQVPPAAQHGTVPPVAQHGPVPPVAAAPPVSAATGTTSDAVQESSTPTVRIATAEGTAPTRPEAAAQPPA
ncbi:phage shock protein C, PspC [Micromonospora maris AB-18-032]|nr:phage shock protein C, PspC [Micromonospora maris AB-18-032]